MTNSDSIDHINDNYADARHEILASVPAGTFTHILDSIHHMGYKVRFATKAHLTLLKIPIYRMLASLKSTLDSFRSHSVPGYTIYCTGGNTLMRFGIIQTKAAAWRKKMHCPETVILTKTW
jgi:hypothetical protein